MPTLRIDGIETQVEPGTTLLEAARGLGLEIPTLCHLEGLTPYGGCRLCVVEVGSGEKARLAGACTFPAEEGLSVRTNSRRVVRARKMLVEILLSVAPGSKVLQDLAAKLGVERQRFKVRDDECVLCGLCVRMCSEQMMAGAIDFADRGYKRRITTPFDEKSEKCRACGGCMYVCPVCALRCQGPKAPTGDCGTCVREKKETGRGSWDTASTTPPPRR